jgi:hypothetical protein
LWIRIAVGKRVRPANCKLKQATPAPLSEITNNGQNNKTKPKTAQVSTRAANLGVGSVLETPTELHYQMSTLFLGNHTLFRFAQVHVTVGTASQLRYGVSRHTSCAGQPR